MKCEYCIWRERCIEMTSDCTDYTPADDSQDIEAYEADLTDRHSQYLEFAKEFD